jgi:hypothetical protein
MSDWVQYHNPDEMREYDPNGGDFIVMKKNVHPDPGDRVWLISRRGKPGNYEYLLCRTFLVESSGPNDTGRFPNIPYCVRGTKGKRLVPPTVIERNSDWFKALFQVTQHFHRGLTRIKGHEVIQGLSNLARLP